MAIGDVYHLLDYRAGRKGNLDVFTGDETKVFEKCEVCRVDGGDKEGVGLYFERKNIIEAGCFFGKEGNSVMLDGVARKVNYCAVEMLFEEVVYGFGGGEIGIDELFGQAFACERQVEERLFEGG